MSKKSYECLDNEKEESSGDDSSIVVRKKDKSSLRIRLNRVFSSGGDLKSPQSSAAASSLSNSRGSSPARLSPFNKSSRYSWQSCNFSTKESPRSPVSLSPKNSLPPPSPQSPGRLTPGHETRMKYSPQQQQKARKSESDSIMNGTPCRDLENSRKSGGTRSDSSATTSGRNSSRFSIRRRTNSTGMFAWMRVFRLATMLHQIDC